MRASSPALLQLRRWLRIGGAMTNDAIAETLRVFREQPEKAKGKPQVKARSEGQQALIEAGPFVFRADLPQALGGSNQAPSPTALLLGALAGCAVAFIRCTLAPQLGIRVDAVEATARCETDSRGLLAVDSAQPDLANLEIEIRIDSPDGEAATRDLFEAWRERCPVYLSLIKPMRVAARLVG
jgi:uncharacterized OsmC-like protein